LPLKPRWGLPYDSDLYCVVVSTVRYNKRHHVTTVEARNTHDITETNTNLSLTLTPSLTLAIGSHYYDRDGQLRIFLRPETCTVASAMNVEGHWLLLAGIPACIRD